MPKMSLAEHFDSKAENRDYWKKRNWYYHQNLENLLCFLIPKKQLVLEIGAGTGGLLNAVMPSRGVGVDISPRMIGKARSKYPFLEWRVDNAEDLKIGESFDYIILSDLIGSANDIGNVFYNLRRVVNSKTKIVITYYNYLWEPILRLAELLHIKDRQPLQNWLSLKDIENILYINGFEVIKSGNRLVFPIYIPFISTIINRYIGNLPLIRKIGVIQYLIARPIPRDREERSVSIIIPCRNEKGNIENAVKRIPRFGTYQEIIFIEKGSSDGTLEEIKRVARLCAGKQNIHWYEGMIDSKRDKVRLGFEKAKGDIFMILDADLTMPPEDLPKFYNAIVSGRGEFINGSRLVYPLENESMRFLNILGNKFFSLMFSWILGQRIKDTLCGTKVLFKKDYKLIADNRKYFGDFDPFGDFDLLFGAAKLNLKIVEMPIRYQARTYGETNIQRWRHGWLLLKMTLFALRKFKIR
ncbi:MAG: glycosyltransferase [Candidatus Staskawiczbacteria bacterium]|nr:glycosyltransferase [Candidatus Staskawiczbacteria bacterium]